MKIKNDFVTNSSSASFLLADTRKDKSKPIILEYNIADKNMKFNLFKLLPCREVEEDEDKEEILREHEKKGKIDLMFYNIKDIDLISCYAADDAEDPLEVGICYCGIYQDNIKTKGVIVLEGEGGY
jgi:hypothetical protein